MDSWLLLDKVLFEPVENEGHNGQDHDEVNNLGRGGHLLQIHTGKRGLAHALLEFHLLLKLHFVAEFLDLVGHKELLLRHLDGTGSLNFGLRLVPVCRFRLVSHVIPVNIDQQ